VAGDADFYELAYGTPSYPRHRWEYGRAIAILQSLSPPGPRRVLELGAGMGQFIKRLLRIPDFTRERIVATEYCPASIHALRSLGVQAERCGVIDLAAGAGHQASFDAACAFQSFEHMANAVEVIFALKKLVKPGGLIILSVPHGPAIDFNERYLSCLDMPPNHVGRWYRESFEVLAKKAELELTRHEIEPRRLLQVLREVALLRLHARAGSNPRSLAARAQTLGNQGLRRTWSAALGSLMLPPLLPAMRCLRSGFSQLVVLRVPR
jgi:SAM-dependent methyltransferase